MNEYVPPDGGWGYMVAASITVMFTATVVPISSFGLVFGPLLCKWGNETSDTSLTNGMFNTITCFTGLVANQLLRRFSARKVGLAGSVLFFIGCLSTAFVTDLATLIIAFSGVQGVGFGLMIPALFATFNDYFDKKKNVMNNSAQAAILAMNMVWPEVSKRLMSEYGFRGTVLIFAAFSLHTIPAMVVLQPVKWHLVRRSSIGSEKLQMSVADVTTPSVKNPERKSETLSKWQQIVRTLDLDLFKDPLYISISFGIAVSLASELAFTALLPLLLINVNFTIAKVAQIMTIYFASDLACRIILSVTTAFLTVNNRYIYFLGAVLTAVFRTAFIMDNSFTWKAVTVAVLGFMRCLIQTPIPLVIAENYSSRFATAFSLYMAICGVVNLILGILIGLVKKLTGSDDDVVHLLTAAYFICIIPWSIEMFGSRIFRRKNRETV